VQCLHSGTSRVRNTGLGLRAVRILDFGLELQLTSKIVISKFMHSIEFDLSPYGSPQISLCRHAHHLLSRHCSSPLDDCYRGSRRLIRTFISSSFAANCSRLLLLLVFGKTVDWTAIASIRVTVVLACNGDYSHSGCLSDV